MSVLILFAVIGLGVWLHRHDDPTVDSDDHAEGAW